MVVFPATCATARYSIRRICCLLGHIKWQLNLRGNSSLWLKRRWQDPPTYIHSPTESLSFSLIEWIWSHNQGLLRWEWDSHQMELNPCQLVYSTKLKHSLAVGSTILSARAFPIFDKEINPVPVAQCPLLWKSLYFVLGLSLGDTQPDTIFQILLFVCVRFEHSNCIGAIPYWNVPHDKQNFATFSSLWKVHKKEWSYVLLSYYTYYGKAI